MRAARTATAKRRTPSRRERLAKIRAAYGTLYKLSLPAEWQRQYLLRVRHEKALRKAAATYLGRIASGVAYGKAIAVAREQWGTVAKFDPDQPRDEDGRWTGTGFHGTRIENLDAILRDGIEGRLTGQVFLADSEQAAAGWGGVGHHGRIAVFEVHVPPEHVGEFRSHYAGETYSGERSIPAEWIKGYTIYSPTKDGPPHKEEHVDLRKAAGRVIYIAVRLDDSVAKFNENHDERGRFTWAEGGSTYHGTLVRNAERIMREGFKPGFGTGEVFITRDRAMAQRYGYEHASTHPIDPGNRYAVIEVRVPKDRVKDFEPLGPDIRAIRGAIPAEWVVGYDVYENRPGWLSDAHPQHIERVDNPKFKKADTETFYVVVFDDAEDIAKAASDDRTRVLEAVQKAIADMIDAGDVDDVDEMIAYLADIAKAAGISATTILGIPKGFQWADARSAFERLFPDLVDEVSGWLTNAAGQFAGDIAAVVTDATNPARPSTIQEIMREIRAQMPDMKRWKAEQIARTESARVYGNVAQETMERNGIMSRRWLTAEDSPAAADTPVCDYCLAAAEMGWVPTEDNFIGEHLLKSGDVRTIEVDAPPMHPNCRCDIASNTRGWLPPKIPFDGNIDEELAASFDGMTSADLPVTTTQQARRFRRLPVGYGTYVRAS